MLNAKQLGQEFRRTKRTASIHPILDSPPIFSKPESEWHSTEFIRLITYELTGFHTFHAQHNLIIIREFLNQLGTGAGSTFVEAKLRNGIANFYTSRRRRKFSFSFRPNDGPLKETFLAEWQTFMKE